MERLGDSEATDSFVIVRQLGGTATEGGFGKARCSAAGNCLEAAVSSTGDVIVRDTQARNVHLGFEPSAWTGLLSDLRAGRLTSPPQQQ